MVIGFCGNGKRKAIKLCLEEMVIRLLLPGGKPTDFKIGRCAFLFLDLSIAQKNRNAIKIRLQYGNNSVTNNYKAVTTVTKR